MRKPYTWPPGKPAPTLARTFLSDEAYAEAMLALIPLCADVLLYLPDPNRLVLAVRNNKPAQGPWVFGGRVWPGETPQMAAQRHFMRDAGTVLAPERMLLLPETAVSRDYLWHDRQQVPQDVPHHTHAYTFAVQPTPEELAVVAASLTMPEYVPGSLFEADWERLQAADIHPVLRDMHVAVFGTEG